MSTNEIFNQMLSSYDITTELQKRNAIFEVNQQIILSGLYNGGSHNRKLTLVALRRSQSCYLLFHRKYSSCMYYHRHSVCNTDIQDWSALPMAFWLYGKRIE